MVWGPARGGAIALASAALLAAGCACTGTAWAGPTAAPSLAAASAPAHAAAVPSTDLGGPNYNGYCQHLGLVRAQLTPSKEWACLHSDGTTTPLELQAACEFSFTQRPIAAAQLSPGIPYTWQCYAAQPGKVVLPPGAGGGGGGSSPLAFALRRALTPTGRGAKIGRLLRNRRYTTSFHAPGLARLTLSWYYQPRHARRTLVATGTTTFSRAATRSVAIALTARGRRLLKRASRLAVSGRASYVANASTPVAASASFTLRR